MWLLWCPAWLLGCCYVVAIVVLQFVYVIVIVGSGLCSAVAIVFWLVTMVFWVVARLLQLWVPVL